MNNWKDIVKMRREMTIAIEKLRLAFVNATTTAREVGNTITMYIKNK